MKIILRKAALCVALISITIAACSFAAYAEDAVGFEPFIRVDRDDPNAYDRELENLRFITGDMYEFQELDEKYRIPKDYVPVETSLDTLYVSASAQFNDWQFHGLAGCLREVAGGKKIVILDLRRESHALLNGRPFSVYRLHNWSNPGLSTDEIMADEERYFSSLDSSLERRNVSFAEMPGILISS